MTLQDYLNAIEMLALTSDFDPAKVKIEVYKHEGEITVNACTTSPIQTIASFNTWAEKGQIFRTFQTTGFSVGHTQNWDRAELIDRINNAWIDLAKRAEKLAQEVVL